MKPSQRGEGDARKVAERVNPQTSLVPAVSSTAARKRAGEEGSAPEDAAKSWQLPGSTVALLAPPHWHVWLWGTSRLGKAARHRQRGSPPCSCPPCGRGAASPLLSISCPPPAAPPNLPAGWVLLKGVSQEGCCQGRARSGCSGLPLRVLQAGKGAQHVSPGRKYDMSLRNAAGSSPF